MCNLMMPPSGGSAWNREQNDSKARGKKTDQAITDHLA